MRGKGRVGPRYEPEPRGSTLTALGAPLCLLCPQAESRRAQVWGTRVPLEGPCCVPLPTPWLASALAAKSEGVTTSVVT